MTPNPTIERAASPPTRPKCRASSAFAIAISIDSLMPVHPDKRG